MNSTSLFLIGKMIYEKSLKTNALFLYLTTPRNPVKESKWPQKPIINGQTAHFCPEIRHGAE